jgi:hypothetical protein
MTCYLLLISYTPTHYFWLTTGHPFDQKYIFNFLGYTTANVSELSSHPVIKELSNNEYIRHTTKASNPDGKHVLTGWHVKVVAKKRISAIQCILDFLGDEWEEICGLRYIAGTFVYTFCIYILYIHFVYTFCIYIFVYTFFCSVKLCIWLF